MAPKMFHKLYSFVLLFLPKLYMSILAGCYNEIRPGKRKKTFLKMTISIGKS